MRLHKMVKVALAEMEDKGNRDEEDKAVVRPAAAAMEDRTLRRRHRPRGLNYVQCAPARIHSWSVRE
jgi:hypothetical protein